jgi:hypothetical protein
MNCKHKKRHVDVKLKTAANVENLYTQNGYAVKLFIFNSFRWSHKRFFTVTIFHLSIADVFFIMSTRSFLGYKNILLDGASTAIAFTGVMLWLNEYMHAIDSHFMCVSFSFSGKFSFNINGNYGCHRRLTYIGYINMTIFKLCFSN